MLFRSSVRESFSWYFPVMQPRTLPVEPAVVTPRRRPSMPLSVIYADALYRPVPPVEYDDEGYPGPDGRVSESTRHAEASNYCFDALRVWFRDQPATLVANDLVMLFEKGNPKAALSPDLMVVFNAGNPDRSSYKVWEEGDAVPAFALEVLSKRTWRKDVRVKPGLYAALGVREFWLFEPFEPALGGLSSGWAASTRAFGLRQVVAYRAGYWAWRSSWKTTASASGTQPPARPCRTTFNRMLCAPSQKRGRRRQ